MGRKQRFNPHCWCYCQPRVSFFLFLCLFSYWMWRKSKFPLSVGTSLACGFGRKCTLNNFYYLFCAYTTFLFKYVAARIYWTNSKILVLNNPQRHLLGYQRQSATSQLFWLPNPSIDNSSWVFQWRGDLCSFQEPAPYGTKSFSDSILQTTNSLWYVT